MNLSFARRESLSEFVDQIYEVVVRLSGEVDVLLDVERPNRQLICSRSIQLEVRQNEHYLPVLEHKELMKER